MKKNKVRLFLDDILEVYKKHGLALSHQDDQGSFKVEPIADWLIMWLNEADSNAANNVTAYNHWLKRIKKLTQRLKQLEIEKNTKGK